MVASSSANAASRVPAYLTSASVQLMTDQTASIYFGRAFMYLSRHCKRLTLSEEEQKKYLEVVCVLPHIDADDGDFVSHDGVLVLCGDDAQAALGRRGTDEPSPAGALHLVEGAREAIDHVVKGPKRRAHGRREAGGAGLWVLRVLRGGRGEVSPEEGMVDVAAAVELDVREEGYLVGNVGGFRVGGQCVVEVVDVGLVVAIMVKGHDRLGDGGFEGLARCVSAGEGPASGDSHCRRTAGLGGCISAQPVWAGWDTPSSGEQYGRGEDVETEGLVYHFRILHVLLKARGICGRTARSWCRG